MGDYRIVIEAAGGHGCQREVKNGQPVEGCFRPGCPDCETRRFVKQLQLMGNTVSKAELTHWPADMENRNYTVEHQVKDNLLTRIRTGSFALALLVLGLLALPAVAFAAPGSAIPVLSLGDQALAFFLSPAGIASAIAALGTVLGLILGPSIVRRRRLAKGIYHAFHISEDLHSEMPENATITKVETALQALDDYMKANGWRELTPGEQALAKLGFSSLHGEDKVAEKLAVAAAQAGAQAAPAPVAIAAVTSP